VEDREAVAAQAVRAQNKSCPYCECHRSSFDPYSMPFS